MNNFDDDIKKTNDIIDNVSNLIGEKKFQDALSIIEDLVNELEAKDIFKNNEYFSFNTIMEELIYRHTHNIKNEIHHSPINYSEIYLIYGCLLFELKNYHTARRILKKALKWNPVNTDIIFEYAEIFKVTNNFDKFAEITKSAFEYAYTAKSIARIYRNLGFYYIESNDFELASALYIISLSFDNKNENAISELNYISQVTNKEIELISIEEIVNLLKKAHIPVGANNDILSLTITHGKNSAEIGDFETSKYFLNILYELTNDNEVKKLMDSLPEE